MPQLQQPQQQNPLVAALAQALTLPNDVSMTQSQGSPSNPAGVTYSPNPKGNSAPIDLGQLIIQAQRAMPQAPAVPQMPVQAPISEQPKLKEAPKLDANGQTGFGRFLAQMGLPLLSTGVGLASQDALPGAAGFTTGFNTGRKEQLDRNLKEKNLNAFKDTYTFNPDTGEYESTGVKIPKTAVVKNLTSKEKLDLANNIFGQLGLDIKDVQTGSGVKSAETQTKEVQGQPTGRIRVKSKSSGQVGSILESDFDSSKYEKV